MNDKQGFPALGRWMCERRKALGLTQTELGEKVGLQASAIAKYENGRIGTISAETLQAFTDVLGPTEEPTRHLSCIQDRGLSYGELADRAGLPKSSIQRWATGETKTIPADSAAALGTALGVSGAYLLGLETSDKTGARICARRKELRMTAEELAQYIGVSPATMYRYENGDIATIPEPRLAQIAAALSTTISALRGEAKPIILRVPATKGRHDEARLTGVVRISPEAELALLALSGKTGLSLKYIASELIVQAAQMCDIEHE